MRTNGKESGGSGPYCSVRARRDPSGRKLRTTPIRYAAPYDNSSCLKVRTYSPSAVNTVKRRRAASSTQIESDPIHHASWMGKRNSPGPSPRWERLRTRPEGPRTISSLASRNRSDPSSAGSKILTLVRSSSPSFPIRRSGVRTHSAIPESGPVSCARTQAGDTATPTAASNTAAVVRRIFRASLISLLASVPLRNRRPPLLHNEQPFPHRRHDHDSGPEERVVAPGTPHGG